MSIILETQNISKSFPGVKALDDVSLKVRTGSVHAVVGENGAGKSTLMKILSGIYRADAGNILLNNKAVEFASTRAAEAAGIVLIHQELNLVPALSVAENIFLGCEPARFGFVVNQRKMEHDSIALLERLGHQLNSQQDVASLKISDQQIVEIAKALSKGAHILIMDEPTTALSTDDVQRLFRIIRTLTASGNAVIYISHKMDELFDIADEFTVLRDGRLIGHRIVAETTPEELARMMVGRDITYIRKERYVQADMELLSIKALSMEKGGGSGCRRLSDISFNLHRGEIIGIAGLMGAGRTELLESLFGLHRLSIESQIEVRGQTIKINDPRQAIKAGFAFVTEDRKAQGLIPDLSVGNNITLTQLKQFSSLGFIRSEREEHTAQQSITGLGIKTQNSKITVNNLSGGNQQKVVLARWLLTDLKILLLDEPTKGIDIKGKTEIYQLIEDLAARGVGVILVSSELPELLALSDRIIVLRDGRLADLLNCSEVTEERIIELATIENGKK